MTRALIIDDQQLYRNSLREMIESMPGLNLVIAGEASGVQEGLKALEQLQPDLVFLDVEMPDGTGFDLLGALEKTTFDIIFTTSHGEYALKAIKHSALDFLLKPIDAEELRMAVQKAEQKKQHSQQSMQLEVLFQNLRQANNPDNKIGLPVQNGLVFIKVNDIIRCQADGGNYASYHLVNGNRLSVTRSLKETEALLSGYTFMRVHDSHLINLKHIKQYIKGEGGTVVMSDDSEVAVSRYKKEEFRSKLKELRMI